MKYLLSVLCCSILACSINAQPPVMPALPEIPPPPVPTGAAQVTVIHSGRWYVYYIDRKLSWSLSLETGYWYLYSNDKWSTPVAKHNWKR